MVHLDKLHAEMSDKGLSILAITKQDRAAVDKFVEETGAKHPIVLESSDSMSNYGCNSYPSSFLIGPDGRILWTGHPGNLQDSVIEEALQQAQILPEFPKALASARKQFDKEKFADAQTAVLKAIEGGKLEEADAAVATKIDTWLTWYAESTVTEAGKSAEAGDFYEAWVAYEDISKGYKGSAIGKRAASLAAELLSDGEKKDEIKAGDRFAKIRAEIRGMSSKKTLKALAPMTGKSYRDTRAGKAAAALIAELEAAE